MTDKELIELAAKAAGIDIKWKEWVTDKEWNPLTDDGDALRLAVKLNLGVNVTSGLKWTTITFFGPQHDMPYIEEKHGDDPYAATRRAIVRAAAEIGRTL